VKVEWSFRLIEFKVQSLALEKKDETLMPRVSLWLFSDISVDPEEGETWVLIVSSSIGYIESRTTPQYIQSIGQN